MIVAKSGQLAASSAPFNLETSVRCDYKSTLGAVACYLEVQAATLRSASARDVRQCFQMAVKSIAFMPSESTHNPFTAPESNGANARRFRVHATAKHALLFRW